MKLAACLVGAALIVWFAARPYDVMGLCPMALDMIKFDTGMPGAEKALASWKEFSETYRCAKR